MKEWLLKTEDGKYHYYRDDMDCCPKYVEKIEIPEDCNFVTIIDKKILFWLYSGLVCCFENGGISAKYKPVHNNVMEYLSEFYGEAYIIWERKVHQIEDDSVVDAEYLPEKKHSHYFKDVSNLLEIDVYRVLKLFEVTDPCIQHAVKKLLCAGGRGVKDVDKDVHEAIDSLLRYEEMRKEDEANS